MNWKYIFISIIGIWLLSSCYDENTLKPTEDGEDMLRFEFPQGNNSWDQDIVDIAEEFDVYLIYKDLKYSDVNRSWTGLIGVEYFAEGLNDEQAVFSVNFLKNHVFAYLNKEITKKVLPMYYYMAYDYHNSFTMDLIPGWTFVYKVSQKNVFDGLDFWSICLFYGEPCQLTGETIETPVTKKDFLMRRGQVLQKILDGALDKGNIVVPASFHEGFDYKTEVTYKYGDEEDENYFVRRGFPGVMQIFADSFSKLEKISDINPESNFEEYIHLGLRYTKEELETVYPQATYPFLWTKRDYVVNYMKTMYNIDLEAMAEGPEIE